MNFQNYSDESVEDCKIVSSDMYRQKKGTIRQAAGSFLPREAGVYGSVDVMLLACTSMSFVLGTSDVQEVLSPVSIFSCKEGKGLKM